VRKTISLKRVYICNCTQNTRARVCAYIIHTHTQTRARARARARAHTYDILWKIVFT